MDADVSFDLPLQHQRAADRPGLSLWPAETCLMTELSAALNRLTANELRHCHVILPTKRLGTWLLAMLAQERGAFIPPRCSTLGDFIAAHAPNANSERRAMPDLEQELLLASLLKDSHYRHLRYGHEHEIKQLLGEFADSGMELTAFAQLRNVVAQNVFLSEGSLDTLSERFGELHDLAQRFYAAVATTHGATTAAQLLAAQSAALAASLAPERGTPTAWGQLYVVGLTSAQSVHQPLLSTLTARPDCQIWINEAPPLSGGKNPLELLRHMTGSSGTLRRVSAPRPKPATLQVRRADTVLAEVAHALSLAKAAIASGIAPSGIALLVTNDAAYGKPLRALLRASGISANVALGTPLVQTLPGTWLSAVVELLLGEQTVAHTIALLIHPLTRSWWQRMHVGATGDLPALTSSRISRELCASQNTEGLQALLTSRRLSADVKAYLQTLLTALGCWVEPSPAAGRPLAQWAAVLNALVADLLTSETPPDDDGFDKGLLLSAQTSLTDFCSSLHLMAQRLPMRLTQREFLHLLRDKLLAVEVRSVGDPLHGLQVLSVAEARYVPFDLALVLGASEGDFPRALPRDHLIDNYLKTKIGLPGWQLLEAIEDTTFSLLQARLPAMVLLYPATRAGEPVVRSRFIEAALALGQAQEHRLDADDELLAMLAKGAAATGAPNNRRPIGVGDDRVKDERPAAADANAATSRLGPQGHIPLPLRTQLLASQSATSLSYLLSCPYRFLLHRLKVRPQELPATDDVRREGDWLHLVLESFFSGHAHGQTLLPPLQFTGPSVGWEEQARLRLAHLTDRLLPVTARDSPLELQVRTTAWPAFAAHVARLYAAAQQPDSRTGRREQRVVMDDGQPVTLPVGGIDVTLNGSLDSIDVFASWHLVTDYKRRFAPNKKALKEAREPQLLLYAAALACMQERRPLSQAVIGYWNILAGCWQEGLAGSEAAEVAKALNLISAREATSLEDAVAHLMDVWTTQQTRLLKPEVAFAPDPQACKHCHYSGICRRDEPSWQAQLQRTARGQR